jgi:hypothetical protein
MSTYVLTAILGVLSASTAGAQPVATSLEEVKALAGVSTVAVTDRAGRTVRGTIADASATELRLRVGPGIRRFDVADVGAVRLRKHDPLANGAVIGALVGGGLTALVFLDNECHDDPACYRAVAAYAGIGAAVGVGVDALLRDVRLIYAAPVGAAPLALTMAPVVGPSRRGVRVTLTF